MRRLAVCHERDETRRIPRPTRDRASHALAIRGYRHGFLLAFVDAVGARIRARTPPGARMFPPPMASPGGWVLILERAVEGLKSAGGHAVDRFMLQLIARLPPYLSYPSIMRSTWQSAIDRDDAERRLPGRVRP
jgi:hypothetical protein